MIIPMHFTVYTVRSVVLTTGFTENTDKTRIENMYDLSVDFSVYPVNSVVLTMGFH